MANQFLEIPDSFWGLFRSRNRQIYIDALLKINEEYQYSNYFLSREICIQALSDHFARQKVTMEQDELEDDFDVLEPLATRVLNWLLRTGWLRKVDDYNTMTVNIVIPGLRSSLCGRIFPSGRRGRGRYPGVYPEHLCHFICIQK